MAEYISKQKVLKILERHSTANGCALGRHSGAVDCIMAEIEHQPSADVADIGHARWEVDELGFLRCTNCGWIRHGVPLVELYPHCPWCGWKMDGGADNGE